MPRNRKYLIVSPFFVQNSRLPKMHENARNKDERKFLKAKVGGYNSHSLINIKEHRQFVPASAQKNRFS